MDFWSSLTEIGGDVTSGVVSILTKLTEIFYTPASGSTAAAPTFLGYLALAGIVISIVGYGLSFITRFISKRIGR